MVTRTLEQSITKRFFKRKAILLLGARQVGKTTFIQKVLSAYDDVLLLDCEDGMISGMLQTPNTAQVAQIMGKHKVVFIDEAQKVDTIGSTAKLIVDHFPGVQLIMSGSSAFDLANITSEPLTGRKWTYHLYPISWQEWENHIGYVKAEQDLENRLVFGFYPDVLNHLSEQATVLKELSDSYLYKDILMYGGIKKPEEIHKLLQAISFQLGNEVSYTELAQMTGIDPKTVERYIIILERAYVIFRLQPLSGNLRNEIKSKRKIYFYDNGVRNIVISQLQPLSVRQDIGALWENFMISERQKYLDYNQIIAHRYFWRTTQQQEVDYVEQINGEYFGYEFKWNANRKIKFSKTYSGKYGDNNKGIHRENFREFVRD